MRSKDFIILVGLLWLVLRDRESTGVTLKQTCVYPDGSTVLVPLGATCPGDSQLETYDDSGLSAYPEQPCNCH